MLNIIVFNNMNIFIYAILFLFIKLSELTSYVEKMGKIGWKPPGLIEAGREIE